MDAAFVEIQRMFSMDCVVFQDVDTILEDDRNLYRCHPKYPVHLAPGIDRHGYK